MSVGSRLWNVECVRETWWKRSWFVSQEILFQWDGMGRNGSFWAVDNLMVSEEIYP